MQFKDLNKGLNSKKQNKLLEVLAEKELDLAIGLCDSDASELLEFNNTLATWLSISAEKKQLCEYFTDVEIKRFIKCALKGRVFRFKKQCNINARKQTIEFTIKPISLAEGDSYLLLQGIINNTDIEIERMMREHHLVSEKHKQQLNESKKIAESASQAKSMFLATMSHEIRTPMNGILGISQLFNNTPLNETQKEYLQTIQSSGKQLLAIINEVLDYSALDANTIKLHPTSCDLVALINDVITICHPSTLKKTQLTLDCKFNRERYPTVLVDHTRLKQILINLLNNAIKFTEQGVVVLKVNLLSCADKICQLELIIQDTGIGLDQSTINKLFTPFTQKDASTTRQYGGTGLGLSICQQLVDLMNGEITVSSEVGIGSEFTVNLSLPIDIDFYAKKSVQSNSEQQNTNNVDLSDTLILIVDDTKLNRDILKMALQEQHAQLLFAEDGAQAVQLFKENTIDLILMDCLMPVMDGFQATQAIRQLQEQHIPIIAVTASTSEDIRLQCEKSGMDKVLHKPIDFNQLIEEIVVHLRKG